MRWTNLVDFAIAIVWLVNGLVCKLLDLVPRHREIVARILGDEHPLAITRTIGVSEIMMAVWVLSRVGSRLNAVVQILIVLMMNIIEFIFAPDLLLFGRFNTVVALTFCVVVYYREFHASDARLS